MLFKAGGTSRHSGSRLLLPFLAAALIPLLPALNDAASATPLTFRFGGLLDPGSTFPAIAPGTPFSGVFRYESVQADGSPHPLIGVYDIAGFSLTIGGETATVAPLMDAQLVGNNLGGDLFNITANVPNISGTFGGMSLGQIRLDLLDFSSSAFSDDSLPTAIDLADFSAATISIQDISGAPVRLGTVTTLTTPEPSALAALASLSLIGGIAAYRQRKKREVA